MTTINPALTRSTSGTPITSVGRPLATSQPVGIHLSDIISGRGATPVSFTAAPASSGIWSKFCSLLKSVYSVIKNVIGNLFCAKPAAENVNHGGERATYGKAYGPIDFAWIKPNCAQQRATSVAPAYTTGQSREQEIEAPYTREKFDNEFFCLKTSFEVSMRINALPALEQRLHALESGGRSFARVFD